MFLAQGALCISSCAPLHFGNELICLSFNGARLLEQFDLTFYTSVYSQEATLQLCRNVSITIYKGFPAKTSPAPFPITIKRKEVKSEYKYVPGFLPSLKQAEVI